MHVTTPASPGGSQLGSGMGDPGGTAPFNDSTLQDEAFCKVSCGMLMEPSLLKFPSKPPPKCPKSHIYTSQLLLFTPCSRPALAWCFNNSLSCWITSQQTAMDFRDNADLNWERDHLGPPASSSCWRQRSLLTQSHCLKADPSPCAYRYKKKWIFLLPWHTLCVALMEQCDHFTPLLPLGMSLLDFSPSHHDSCTSVRLSLSLSELLNGTEPREESIGTNIH